MRKWTEKDALECLHYQGVESRSKNLILSRSLIGLKACSALDYLKSLNYKVLQSFDKKQYDNKKLNKT